MKKLATLLFALIIALGLAAPAHAARVFVAVGPGAVYYPGYYGYPGYAYPGYYPAYYAAPPVVYAPPPPPTYVVGPAVPSAGAPVAANQTSPTFVDDLGRTCRQFQTTNGAAQPYGTACLMSDGSWRTVQ